MDIRTKAYMYNTHIYTHTHTYMYNTHIHTHIVLGGRHTCIIHTYTHTHTHI